MPLSESWRPPVRRIITETGRSAVAVRHPMPYGDLTAQVVQRFSDYADFDRRHRAIEEREEYEPLVDRGITVFAGIDYARILVPHEDGKRNDPAEQKMRPGPAGNFINRLPTGRKTV